ncbi:sucrase ferredoxin [Nocardioides flavus (ex Wang et al. 2016)]|uniref:Sucrase ferredoxin n=1 Tax=Nocardioides flavus (ex Wang et al. 2016) TaxID=2058780 RepID=A0ABQ3HG34_9ACTN|nr:sucrase ferredoxin [Nocardioides flavus (ex Wang et al. 2016)]GHE15206.1 sucrase ferredoxin [Nocardioides flavus (ex Wang et al. 2016)]
MTGFRCAVASRERGDELAGTASTVRSFLLVEHAGPWGVDALRDARLPDGLGEHLREQARRHRVRVLLVRRPGRHAGAGPVRVVAARAAGPASWLETTLLDDVEDVRSLDLAGLGAGRSMGLEPSTDPLLAVCTHGRHDACCAELGRPVALALADGSHADATWESSHVGGDRFAGNLVVLPRGLYHGGLGPESARAVADATAAGELLLEHFRGRSDLPMAAQAADIALRRQHGLTGLDDVLVRRVRTDGDLTTVRCEVSGLGACDVVVRRVPGEDAHQLTCSARRASTIPRHEVVEVSPAGS